ncbi:hypothetical protein LzC2_39820 [Planctomycetes bacterium LzC2]|uniref:Uncharacterized protein n=1 Tax=Alienimonas chondri TaxID=2681879 RepID=A0ABX1VLJ1_9PLAN|nr:hypothetical protein [Alienimonas chondri]
MSRPAVTKFAFRLFDRPLHPELFPAAATERIERPLYTATLSLGEDGHRIEVRTGGRTLTELLAPADYVLPAGGRRVGRGVRGAGLEDLTFDDDRGPAVRYQAGHQAETPAAGVFDHITAELLADAAATVALGDGEERAPLKRSDIPGQTARPGALACRFTSGGRLAGDSVGLMRVEAAADSLLIHAAHTFADTRTVVRTQSLWEWIEP